MTNPTNNDVIFSFDRPTVVELFNAKSFDVKYTCTDQVNSRVNEVISRLRTDHLNPDERASLIQLCSQYSVIFYINGQPLTFKIKSNT